MTRALALGLTVALAACGSTSTSSDISTSTSTSTSGGGTSGSGPSGGGPSDRCAGSCTEGAVCRNALAYDCACSQVYDMQCGGAAREPLPPTWQWVCTPRDPTTDRGDGCPYAAPAQDALCDHARACRYADGCGWSGTDATCEGGRWTLTPFMLPPPP